MQTLSDEGRWENHNWEERVGQRPAQNEGFSLIADAITIPPYESACANQDTWDTTVAKFLKIYPQMLNIPLTTECNDFCLHVLPPSDVPMRNNASSDLADSVAVCDPHPTVGPR